MQPLSLRTLAASLLVPMLLLGGAAACDGSATDTASGQGGSGDGGSGAGGSNVGGGATGGGGSVFTPPEKPWLRQVGGENGQYARGIAFDKLGNLYVTGRGETRSNLDDDPVVESSGGSFFAKLDPDGKLLWTRALTQSDLTQNAASVSVSTDGDIVVSGLFAGTIDLGAGPLESGPDPADVATFVAAFLPDGSIVRSIALPAGIEVARNAHDPECNTLIAGSFTRPFSLAGESFVPQKKDAVIIKLDAELEPIWVHVHATADDDWFADVASDIGGNVVAVGAARASEAPAVSTSLDLALNPDGGVIWKRMGSEPGASRSIAVAVGPDHSMAVVEERAVGADPAEFVLKRFDASHEEILSTPLTGAARVRIGLDSNLVLFGKNTVDENLYVERRGASGEVLQRTILPVMGYLCSAGLGDFAVDPLGGLALAGFFGAEAEQGPSLSVGSDTIVSRWFDGFFARLDHAAMSD